VALAKLENCDRSSPVRLNDLGLFCEVRKDYFSEILGGACSERLPDSKQVIEQVDLAELPDGLNAIARRLRITTNNSTDPEPEKAFLQFP